MDRRAFMLPFLVLPLLGCSQDSTASSAGDAASQEDAAGPGQAPPAADLPGPEPIATHQTRTAEGPAVPLPGAVFHLPADWQQQPPSSSMRLAQAAIPGPGGAGELTVFHFGVGGGGGVEGNIQRWIGQVDAESPPARDVFSSGDFTVTWVEARGTLKASTMGTGPTEDQPGSMLLGAVVEGPGGPWYFKATGPADTMDQERENFLAMLRSLRSGG